MRNLDEGVRFEAFSFWDRTLTYRDLTREARSHLYCGTNGTPSSDFLEQSGWACVKSEHPHNEEERDPAPASVLASPDYCRPDHQLFFALLCGNYEAERSAEPACGT